MRSLTLFKNCGRAGAHLLALDGHKGVKEVSYFWKGSTANGELSLSSALEAALGRTITGDT